MKKRIAILPLDTRPCCYEFTKRIGGMSDFEIVQPPKNILGGFTNFGDQEAVIAWIQEVTPTVDGLIVSIDQLLYGGLVPSRTVERELADCLQVADLLKEIKKRQPNLPIFAANILMRLSVTAKNKQYAEYWKQIFEYSQIYDRVHRLQQSELEQTLMQLEKEIPESVLSDYWRARERNHAVNQYMIALTAEGVIDYLIIPQEDTSAVGVHVPEQMELMKRAYEEKVQDKVLIYPGADEGTQTLLARMIQTLQKTVVKIYPKYMTVGGRLQIAPFEDRPIEETVVAHITAAGAIVVDTPEAADLILYVNTPLADKKPFSSRHLVQPFVQSLKHDLSIGRKVSIADVAYPNAADQELVQLLLQEKVFFQLHSYAGWNTAGNTIGTTIAHGIVMVVSRVEEKLHEGFLIERLLDEWAYQANVRQKVSQWVVDHLHGDPTNLEKEYETVNQRVKEEMQQYAQEIFQTSGHDWRLATCELPWNRLFEVHVQVQ